MVFGSGMGVGLMLTSRSLLRLVLKEIDRNWPELKVCDRSGANERIEGIRFGFGFCGVITDFFGGFRIPV